MPFSKKKLYLLPFISPISLAPLLNGTMIYVLSIPGFDARSLSKIRRIYCGCTGFGQIFRSFSLNRPHYSPQTIEKSDSNQHTLATIANLGQAPRRFGPPKMMKGPSETDKKAERTQA